MEENVSFYRGLEKDYSYKLPIPTNKHEGGIFFAEDTHKLYLDGEEYGGDGKKRIEDVLLNKDSNLIIKYDDGSTKILSVNPKITTNSVLVDEIEISGGPWAPIVSSVFGNTIPKNITLKDFIEKLVRQEKWPNISYTNGIFNVNVSTPSVSINGTSNGQKVLVGTEVTIGAVSAKEVLWSSSTSMISGMSNGYSKTIDGDVIYKNSISAGEWDIKQKPNSTYTLSRTLIGFDKEGIEQNSAEKYNNCKLNPVTVKVGIGTNSIIIKQQSPYIVGNIEGIEPVYYLSSFNNRDELKKTNKISPQAIEKKPSDTSYSFSVIGVMPCYTNINNNTLGITTVQLPLTTDSVFIFNVPSEYKNNTHFVFEYPATHSINNFEIKDISGNFVPYSSEYEKIHKKITKIINNTEYEYNVFSTIGTMQGDMTCRITLNKTLNK